MREEFNGKQRNLRTGPNENVNRDKQAIPPIVARKISEAKLAFFLKHDPPPPPPFSLSLSEHIVSITLMMQAAITKRAKLM